MFRHALAVSVLVLAASGCSATIDRQEPRPNVALVPRIASMRLVIPAGVPERLEFDPPNVVVEDWRQTLRAGFRNGYGLAYRIAGADAELTLTLDEVRLEMGSFDHAWARIQYKATLSRGGVPVGRSAGLAVKPSGGFHATATEDVAADVSGAVEAMYEQIARDLLA